MKEFVMEECTSGTESGTKFDAKRRERRRGSSKGGGESHLYQTIWGESYS